MRILFPSCIGGKLGLGLGRPGGSSLNWGLGGLCDRWKLPACPADIVMPAAHVVHVGTCRVAFSVVFCGLDD